MLSYKSECRQVRRRSRLHYQPIPAVRETKRVLSVPMALQLFVLVDLLRVMVGYPLGHLQHQPHPNGAECAPSSIKRHLATRGEKKVSVQNYRRQQEGKRPVAARIGFQRLGAEQTAAHACCEEWGKGTRPKCTKSRASANYTNLKSKCSQPVFTWNKSKPAANQQQWR